MLTILFTAGGFNQQKFSFIKVAEKPDRLRSEDLADPQKARPLIEKKNKWISGNPPVQWSVKSDDDLDLYADFFRASSHLYVIAVHGYLGDRSTMYCESSVFSDWNFNILIPDDRAHGKSQGNWIGMGWLDSKDLLKWIEKITDEDKDARIVLYGVSMGGATVMMASGLDLPSNVKCIIEDCGYSSVYDEFAFILKHYVHLNRWPFLFSMNIASKPVAGYGLKEASSLSMLEKTNLPMLFIHGTADTFVPYYMLEKNVNAYNGPYAQVLSVEGAEHAQSYFMQPELYSQTLHDFIFRFINED